MRKIQASKHYIEQGRQESRGKAFTRAKRAKKKKSIHIGLGVRRSILTRSIATRSNPEVLFKALTLLVDLLHIYIRIRTVALTTP